MSKPKKPSTKQGSTPKAPTPIVNPTVVLEEPPVATPKIPVADEADAIEVFVAGVTKRLNQYCVDIHPNTYLVDDVAVSYQHTLYREMLTIGDSDYSHFKPAWDVLSDMFVLHNAVGTIGALSDQYVFRFLSAWRWSQESLNLRNSVCDVLSLLSDKKARKANLKKIDFGKFIDQSRTGMSDKFVENLIRYYGV